MVLKQKKQNRYTLEINNFQPSIQQNGAGICVAKHSFMCCQDYALIFQALFCAINRGVHMCEIHILPRLFGPFGSCQKDKKFIKRESLLVYISK